MTVRFYADQYRCAIYDEASGGGDPGDPNALMNRPVLAPLSWLSSVYFHSDLDYYGIVAKNMNVVVNHAAVPGLARQAGIDSSSVYYYGQTVRTNIPILTHNQGYVPRFVVIYAGQVIPQGIPVQQDDSSRVRLVTPFATTTQILLHDAGISSDLPLSAVSRTYQVLVFREPGANPTGKMLDIYPGAAEFGRGKFRGSEPHLRADGQGDVVWPIATDRTAGIRNGGVKAYYPNGISVTWGPYNGGLAAPPFITTSAGA